LTSPFGTGKTLLLKAKGKQLLEETDEKVVFVIFEESENSLLKIDYQRLFGNHPNAKVTEISSNKGFIFITSWLYPALHGIFSLTNT
jgi:KaiC/GvpD/RAD55 family RecA-like ATPase